MARISIIVRCIRGIITAEEKEVKGASGGNLEADSALPEIA